MWSFFSTLGFVSSPAFTSEVYLELPPLPHPAFRVLDERRGFSSIVSQREAGGGDFSWQKRQKNGKRAAAARFRLYPYVSAVFEGYAAHEKEPETFPAALCPARKAPLKHTRQIRRLNSHTCVAHRDDRHSLLPGERKRDGTVLRCEGKGVVAQILKGGAQTLRVDGGRQRLRGQLEQKALAGELYIGAVVLVEAL